ncbi:hypothetical protein LINGRAHAP2_LOCUS31377 [Linum grandiflorum]
MDSGKICHSDDPCLTGHPSSTADVPLSLTQTSLAALLCDYHHGGESRDEAGCELGVDELAEGSGVEGVAGELALEFPCVSIGVEDAVAEEVEEFGAEVESFLVVEEVGFQHVLDVGWVSGEYTA